jgi:hypothetical protein
MPYTWIKHIILSFELTPYTWLHCKLNLWSKNAFSISNCYRDSRDEQVMDAQRAAFPRPLQERKVLYTSEGGKLEMKKKRS